MSLIYKNGVPRHVDFTCPILRDDLIAGRAVLGPQDFAAFFRQAEAYVHEESEHLRSALDDAEGDVRDAENATDRAEERLRDALETIEYLKRKIEALEGEKGAA